MAKAIKRVGIIFLALAIICLLAVGVLIGASDTKESVNANNSSLNSSNKIENINEPNEEELAPIVEEVLLDGATCEEQAAKWSKAIEKSLASGGNQHILVTMMNDWIAPNSEINSFGEGLGFDNGRIYVQEGVIITLDLNGKIIDRKLTSAIANGNVIFVDKGTLIIKDSCFDYAKVINAYNSDYNAELSNFVIGKITGGYSNGDGGGIYLSHGRLTIDSGMIYNNYAENYGGGIYNYLSVLTINNALINNNYAYNLGGGVFSDNDRNDSSNVVTNINGTIFHKNIGDRIGGGGIRVYGGECNITGGIFSSNSGLQSNSEGGAVYATKCKVKMTGGLFEHNMVKANGAGIRIGGSELGIAYIENIIVRNNYGAVNGGGIRFANDLTQVCTIKNSVVTNNSATGRGGGISVEHEIIIGEGLQVYDNKVNETDNNMYIYANTKLNITEKLLQNGKGTCIRLTVLSSGSFTNGYTSSGNTMHPNRFFYTDTIKRIVLNSSGEVEVDTNHNPENSTKIAWKYEINGSSRATYETYINLPYNETNPYLISNNISDVINEGGQRAVSHQVKEPGTYVFYTDDVRIKNPTFTVVIEQPIKRISKPTIKSYIILYNEKYQTFIPENFNSETMTITYNIKKYLGKYTAKVSLKNALKTTWSDGSTDSVEYSFEIIPPGIVFKENSKYDYIYKDNNNLRQNYKDNNIIHKVSETETTNKYVIGNISQNTNLAEFISNIRKECGYIKIYNGNTLLYDGTTENDASENVLIATGYKVELYKENTATTLLDTAYLSVLGDVVADGIINTLDVTFVNRIAKGEIKLDTLSIERQLAAMVDNKGKVTSTDGKILLNVIGGNLVSQDYFENVASNKDNYQLWNLKEEGGKTFRESIDITTESLVNNAIIGNISPETTAVDFKTKLASQLSIDISAISVHKSNGAVANDNEIIGTGYYINYNGKTIYLSVLGDLTGDGRVNTTDVTYLNRLVNGSITLDISNIKDKLTMLAATIQNKGKLTTADSESLLNYIGNNVDIKQYF